MGTAANVTRGVLRQESRCPMLRVTALKVYPKLPSFYFKDLCHSKVLSVISFNKQSVNAENGLLIHFSKAVDVSTSNVQTFQKLFGKELEHGVSDRGETELQSCFGYNTNMRLLINFLWRVARLFIHICISIIITWLTGSAPPNVFSWISRTLIARVNAYAYKLLRSVLLNEAVAGPLLNFLAHHGDFTLHLTARFSV